MTARSVSITFAGSGGAGVMTAGNMLLDAAGRAGWHGYMTRSSGAQIRGGEAAAMLRLSTEPVESHDDYFDLLVAIDWQNVGRFSAEIPMTSDGLVLGDPEGGDFPEQISAKGTRRAEIPFKKLSKDIPGGRANMIALGAVAALIGLPEDAVSSVLHEALKKKGAEALTSSEASMRAGMEYAANLPASARLETDGVKAESLWSITGNEAAGLGAVRGGIRFVAAYPITPGTEVLEWLAPNLAKLGGVLVQAEDELASINQIIGASYGGTPSLTATAGPGLALMMESIGLAVASEVPIVVVNVMRGGPSTGIPVKSEQSDLNIALYGLHGDAPHLVLAPNTLADCAFTTQWAVQLAEALQTAAIVLSDQSLGQSRATIEAPADPGFFACRLRPEGPLEGRYRRYLNTPSGVSPMAQPGMKGYQYTADGLEHNEIGTPSSHTVDHSTQLDKRLRKLTAYDYGEHWADIEGEGDIAVVTWGSTTGPVREALARWREAGNQARLVSVRLLSPVQPEKLAAALDGVKRVLIVEQSHGAQFHRYLRAHYDLPGSVRAFHRPGPLPIRPAEVFGQLANWS
ncbi:MAG TPA: 2-oxoacid:acceptor oxidoreductase subunit alpha [Azoarcus taiwanensis]|nr:2-oxoacid:acceptor oxidoreductase subunit alpha [Azoarcus taiwanensis]